MIIRLDGERLWASKDADKGIIRGDFKVLSQWQNKGAMAETRNLERELVLWGR